MSRIHLIVESHLFVCFLIWLVDTPLQTCMDFGNSPSAFGDQLFSLPTFVESSRVPEHSGTHGNGWMDFLFFYSPCALLRTSE